MAINPDFLIAMLKNEEIKSRKPSELENAKYRKKRKQKSHVNKYTIKS